MKSLSLEHYPIGQHNAGENADLPDANNPGTPLTDAMTGIVVNARGADLTLLQVTPAGSPGWYKGYGQITLDYFLGLSYGVTFDKIYINENRDVILGRIDVMSKGMEALIEGQKKEYVKKIEAKKKKILEENQERSENYYNEILIFDIEVESISVDI